jgi:hypothetical protein
LLFDVATTPNMATNMANRTRQKSMESIEGGQHGQPLWPSIPPPIRQRDM